MQDRVLALNDRPPRRNAGYVLYWAQMNRRVDANHGLLHAIALANEWKLPVLYYEGLTCSYPWANDRLHTFILEGVPDTAAALHRSGIGYVFYLRRRQSDPNNVLYQLAEHAAAVVTDDYPTFIARTHNQRVPANVDIPYYVVDSSCIVPMRLFPKREFAAYTIRPKIHRLLPKYLDPPPALAPKARWKAPLPAFHTEVTKTNIPDLVASCQIDHSVPPSLSFHGGACAAERHLRHFLDNNLKRYAEGRNEPSAHATSDLSPYLHFGHISSLQVALAAKGRKADEYLEELIVRRELAFNFALHSDKPECLKNLPEWAKTTLREHAADPRPQLYTREQFEHAATYDDLWNATQKELLLRGKIHGYYRMYWGKKIIEWSPTCQDALETMIYLHDRYALDGRDPNTYTNILWCFGLHDRAWTERDVFGKVRYMSLGGMQRKTDVDAYLREVELMERTRKDPFRLTAVQISR
ncbi:MAG: deoxyribodipyrimidine photo-lyase [Bryobacteraceae bacterium]|nr:deoxyribodipyrimidine photo-lyase [Bryobacteraceae bacterium]